jgi:uncharacterized sulfatase
MPQLPYYQNALIFNKGGSYEEINRLRALGQLPDPVLQFFAPKPVELLYDLENDPLEQTNLIDDPEVADRVSRLRDELDAWMIRYRDTGLISEGIMMAQAKAAGKSVYEIARDYSSEQFRAILEVAQWVGQVEDPAVLVPYFDAVEPAQRFWSLVALDAYSGEIEAVLPGVRRLMDDDMPAVRTKAAEILAKRKNDPQAFAVLEQMLKLEDEVQVLQAAISVRQLGEKAQPLLATIQNEVFPNYSGEIWGRYKSWSYPMFIGMALDQTQINCGVEVDTRR